MIGLLQLVARYWLDLGSSKPGVRWLHGCYHYQSIYRKGSNVAKQCIIDRLPRLLLVGHFLDLMFALVLRRSAQLLPLSKRMPTEIERVCGFETLHGRQMLRVVSMDYS